MQYNPEELDEILNIYKAESEEIIQELNDGFLELEKNPENKEPLKKLFQLVHSLKGASRMLGFNSVQDISHKLEDILSYWKKEGTIIEKNSFQEYGAPPPGSTLLQTGRLPADQRMSYSYEHGILHRKAPLRGKAPRSPYLPRKQDKNRPCLP